MARVKGEWRMARRIKHRIIGIENELDMAKCNVMLNMFASYVGPYYGLDTDAYIARNQGRLYPDQEKTMEWATAEAAGPWKAALAEAVSMKRLSDAVDSYNREVKPIIAFFRTTLGAKYEIVEGGKLQFDNTGVAHHVNYLVLPHAWRFATTERAEDNRIVSFLISRSGLVGNGWVRGRGKSGLLRFVFSQRIEHTNQYIGPNSTMSRPLLSSKDEPRANRSFCGRLHDISSNHGASEYQRFLEYVTMDIVLTMLEDREFLMSRWLELERGACLEQARIWNADLWAIEKAVMTEHKFGASEKREMTWLDVQRWWFAQATEFFKLQPTLATHERRFGLDLWEMLLDAYESKDLATLSRYLDCMAIYRFIYLRLHEKYELKEGRTEFFCEIPTKSGPKYFLDVLLAEIIQYFALKESRGHYGFLADAGLVERLFVPGDFKKSSLECRPLWRDTICEMSKSRFPECEMAVEWEVIILRYQGKAVAFKNDNPYRAKLSRYDLEQLGMET